MSAVERLCMSLLCYDLYKGLNVRCMLSNNFGSAEMPQTVLKLVPSSY